MPLVGAAVIPTAPLLVPGVSATLPDGLAEVHRAMAGALARLEHVQLAVLVAAGEGGIYEGAEASLAGFGRPDLAVSLRAAEWPNDAARQAGPLPPGLAVLALLLGGRAPVVPISVDADATADRLTGHGASIATSLPGRGVLVAAGDLSAGLDERSPRHRVEGAVAWDDAVVGAVDAQLPEQLAALGPAEARRAAALGWAPIVVAQAACITAGLRLRARHYSAPRGVGYLIATTDV
ncbi:MAG: hypothetical protein ACRDYA_20680 [Egibacteraceae bacterium]